MAYFRARLSRRSSCCWPKAFFLDSDLLNGGVELSTFGSGYLGDLLSIHSGLFYMQVLHAALAVVCWFELDRWLIFNSSWSLLFWEVWTRSERSCRGFGRLVADAALEKVWARSESHKRGFARSGPRKVADAVLGRSGLEVKVRGFGEVWLRTRRESGRRGFGRSGP